MRKYVLLIALVAFFLSVDIVLAATLSLSPSTGPYQVGASFNVNIHLDTQGADTHGVDIKYLNYNSSLLEVQDADPGTAGVQISPGSLYPEERVMINSVNASQGKIHYSQISEGGGAFNGSGILATVSFKVLTDGQADVNFDFIPGSLDDANVASNGSDILTSVTNGSYTLGAGPPTCNRAGGSCYSNPCSSYQNCSSVSGTCSSGYYCCTGTCSSGPGPDTTPPGMVRNLGAVAGDNQVTLSWTNPFDSDFQGVLIRRQTGSAPVNINNGTQVMRRNATSFTDTGLTNDTTYYYSLFTYDEVPNYSLPVSISVTPQEGGTGGWQYVNGTLLKGSSEKVYILFRDQKCWIKTAAIFETCGFRWEDIITVSDDILARIPDGPVIEDVCLIYPDGTLIKGVNAYRVYVIVEAARRWITSAGIFIGLGYKWEDIIDVSGNILAGIPEGDPITSLPAGIYPDGTLLQALNDYNVYVILTGKKHYIPSASIFNAYGYNWSAIQQINAQELVALPRVILIRAQGDFKVYYLNLTPKGTMKRWLISQEVFLSYGNQWEDVVEILAQERDFYPTVNLIRAKGDSKAYLIEGTVKRWITTAEVFNTRGYDWERVVIVNQTELDAFQNGENIQ